MVIRCLLLKLFATCWWSLIQVYDERFRHVLVLSQFLSRFNGNNAVLLNDDGSIIQNAALFVHSDGGQVVNQSHTVVPVAH